MSKDTFNDLKKQIDKLHGEILQVQSYKERLEDKEASLKNKIQLLDENIEILSKKKLVTSIDEFVRSKKEKRQAENDLKNIKLEMAELIRSIKKMSSALDNMIHHFNLKTQVIENKILQFKKKE